MNLHLAFALILTVASRAKATASLTSNPTDCIDLSKYPADTDFFPDKFSTHETTDLLDVTYHNTYKIITNHHQDKKYLLYQCGTEPPQDVIDDGNFHLVLPIPHKGKLAVTETPQITPLEQLGLRREIASYIGNPKLVSSPCLNQMSQNDELHVIYYEEDPWNSTLVAGGIDSFMESYEDLLILVGPYGDAEQERGLAVAASQERTAVATFDWLGLYAALYNIERTANQIIAETEERYQCSADNSALLSADILEEDKPKVLWAQFFTGIGWSVAECPTWDSAYYCEYAHHCGANIISRPEGVGFNQSYDGGKTLYWYLTDEEFLELGKDAGTWIYPSKTFAEVYKLKSELLDQFEAVKKMEVYDTQGQGAFSWHEQRLGEYDVVALDFCTLVGTTNPNTIHRRRWFRNYFIEPVGSVGICGADEIDEPYVPAEATCIPIGSETEKVKDTDNTVQNESVETYDESSASTVKSILWHLLSCCVGFILSS